jgi:hypothetical protein
MKPGDLPRPVPVSPALQSNVNKGCLIAVAILFALMAFCCVASKQSPEDVDREFQKTLEWERKRGDYR